jgi:hypothetical protein
MGDSGKACDPQELLEDLPTHLCEVFGRHGLCAGCGLGVLVAVVAIGRIILRRIAHARVWVSCGPIAGIGVVDERVEIGVFVEKVDTTFLEDAPDVFGKEVLLIAGPGRKEEKGVRRRVR